MVDERSGGEEEAHGRPRCCLSASLLDLLFGTEEGTRAHLNRTLRCEVGLLFSWFAMATTEFSEDLRRARDPCGRVLRATGTSARLARCAVDVWACLGGPDADDRLQADIELRDGMCSWRSRLKFLKKKTIAGLFWTHRGKRTGG